MEIKTLSSGVAVVRWTGKDWRYLLLRSYRYWDFPKGMVEAGEDPLDAARREVREETTLTRLDFHWGYDYRETAPYGRGKVARYYVAESPETAVRLPINPALGRPEHHAFRWVSYDTARLLLAPRVVPILEWAHTLIRGTT